MTRVRRGMFRLWHTLHLPLYCMLLGYYGFLIILQPVYAHTVTMYAGTLTVTVCAGTLSLTVYADTLNLTVYASTLTVVMM